MPSLAIQTLTNFLISSVSKQNNKGCFATEGNTLIV